MKKLSKHIRRLIVRDKNESSRNATALELLFDLIFVIGIAAVADGLSHEIAAGHIQIGLIKFMMAFFCIWWPWNLFTWFASSFDNDDVLYRINVIVIMFGAMFIAAAIPVFFSNANLVYIFIGYIIMRIAFVMLWVRVSIANPQFRLQAIIYVVGQTILQSLWAINVFLIEPTSNLFYSVFALGVIGEFFVPWYAEKVATPQWHRHHIIERFGLFNIIVLGEVLLGSTHALAGLFMHGFHGTSLAIACSGIVITFAMWWLYFDGTEHLHNRDIKNSFIWGYGHFLVFAAGAAVGAGMSVLSHNSSLEYVGLVISIPVAIYIFGLWLVRDRHAMTNHVGWVILAAIIIIGLSGLVAYPYLLTALFLVMFLVIKIHNSTKINHKGA